MFYILCMSLIIIIIYPLTTRVVGAPQMISQPVSSIFACSPLPSWTWQTPGLYVPWCCLPTSSSVCLVFFPFSLCLARWFWPDLYVIQSLLSEAYICPTPTSYLERCICAWKLTLLTQFSICSSTLARTNKMPVMTVSLACDQDVYVCVSRFSLSVLFTVAAFHVFRCL